MSKRFLIHLATVGLSILFSLAVIAIILHLLNFNPLNSLGLIVWGGVGNKDNLIETLVAASPLLLVGQGLAISFTAKVWNIGAEGQLYMGGLVATWAALMLKNLPNFLVIPLAVILGALAGMAWAFIPAVLRAYRNVNEVFTTLFMNYIAIYIVSYLLFGPLRDPISFYPQSEMLPKSLHIPVLLAKTRLHLGVIFAIFVITPLVYLFLNKTSMGMVFKIFGSSEKSAVYAGIDRERVIMSALLISGSLAGLAGAIEVLAVQYAMRLTLSPGWGYTGIAVAILGYLHPLGVLLASLFFGAIYTGTFTFSALTATPVGMAYMIQGLVLVFTLVGAFLERSILKRWLKVD